MSSIKHKNIPREDKNVIRGGVLYLVATPIGNLSDLSERALKVLREVDFIAAEDTRNTGKLLAYFEISKPMISYFEHNKRERGEVIVAKLKDGQSCALVTDAGTPAISDPGEDLVRLCASMATSFTKAALGAEGIGSDVNMIIGNGYTKGHAEFTLQELRECPELRKIFEELYA